MSYGVVTNEIEFLPNRIAGPMTDLRRVAEIKPLVRRSVDTSWAPPSFEERPAPWDGSNSSPRPRSEPQYLHRTGCLRSLPSKAREPVTVLVRLWAHG